MRSFGVHLQKKAARSIIGGSGLAATCSRAADLIRRGCVKVAGEPALKPGALVAPDAELAVSPEASPYVSRAGLKLEAALAAFGFDPRAGGARYRRLDRRLQRPARQPGRHQVYAVDVGSGQLHAKLRANPKIVSLEGTDARALDRSVIGEPVSAIVADVSFISLTLVLPAAFRLAAPGAWLVALVKPQFEAGRQAVGKGGIVRKAEDRDKAAARVRRCIEGEGWSVLGVIPSPIQGGSGNEEFLIGARRETPAGD
jgi:23S rRNA (cytidine1920-2'-O)/16S rRNA (cytidine1409-2'-O)-methyltransferase